MYKLCTYELHKRIKILSKQSKHIQNNKLVLDESFIERKLFIFDADHGNLDFYS